MTSKNHSGKINYYKWQLILEIVALVIAWILVILYLYDITTIKQLVVLQAILGTATVVWWMMWEKSRLD